MKKLVAAQGQAPLEPIQYGRALETSQMVEEPKGDEQQVESMTSKTCAPGKKQLRVFYCICSSIQWHGSKVKENFVLRPKYSSVEFL